jgi:hypothetical protein
MYKREYNDMEPYNLFRAYQMRQNVQSASPENKVNIQLLKHKKETRLYKYYHH